MVKAEMAKGVRYDSILLGIHFGDSNHDYFGRCLDLNRAGLIEQGEGVSVRYIVSDSLEPMLLAPLEIDFYPTFDGQNKISELRLKCKYTRWTIWNRPLHADSLAVRMQSLLKKWYGGNDFVIAKMDSLEIPVKVDGNRRIMITLLDATQIEVQVQDLMNPMFQHSIYRKEEEKEEPRQ